jgi:putative FmdB family regulatory protein
MPTYDYICDACGDEFELFQSINDPVKRKCQKCGKQKLRRKIGAGAAIVFKGSGFYQTDYRSDKYKQRAAADKPPSESGGDKSSDKSSGEKSSGDKSSSEKSTGSSKSAGSESKSQSKSSDSKGSSNSRKNR